MKAAQSSPRTLCPDPLRTGAAEAVLAENVDLHLVFTVGRDRAG